MRARAGAADLHPAHRHADGVRDDQQFRVDVGQHRRDLAHAHDVAFAHVAFAQLGGMIAERRRRHGALGLLA